MLGAHCRLKMSNNSIKATSIALLSAAALLAMVTRKSKQSRKKVAGQEQVKTPRAPEDGYCRERPRETNGYILQQTMLRIKDPKASLDFYSRVLGMRLIRSFHFPEAKFSLYFMGYIDEAAMPKDDEERKAWLFQQPATLELTHNHGTENQPDFKYNNGNVEPHRGYGHIGIDVPDVFKACERFEKLGVRFQKKLTDGRMKTIAFICDPDGYWIEIFSHNTMAV